MPKPEHYPEQLKRAIYEDEDDRRACLEQTTEADRSFTAALERRASRSAYQWAVKAVDEIRDNAGGRLGAYLGPLETDCYGEYCAFATVINQYLVEIFRDEIMAAFEKAYEDDDGYMKFALEYPALGLSLIHELTDPGTHFSRLRLCFITIGAEALACGVKPEELENFFAIAVTDSSR